MPRAQDLYGRPGNPIPFLENTFPAIGSRAAILSIHREIASVRTGQIIAGKVDLADKVIEDKGETFRQKALRGQGPEISRRGKIQGQMHDTGGGNFGSVVFAVVLLQGEIGDCIQWRAILTSDVEFCDLKSSSLVRIVAGLHFFRNVVVNF